MDFTLDRMLEPLCRNDFLREHWQRKPLILNRRKPDYYAELLTLRDVDSLLYFGRPDFPYIAGASPGGAARRASSVITGGLPQAHPSAAAAVPDLASLGRLYEGGDTLYIHDLERFWRPVAELCMQFQSALHHPTEAGLFLTPPGAAGLPVHYDNQDVFVLQIQGAKHWHIHDPVLALPIEPRELSDSRAELGPVRYDIRLEAGDLLYLPRGYPHEVFTTDSLSLHVTVGIRVFRWSDLIAKALLDLSRRDERFRLALPPGFLGADAPPAGMEEVFQTLLGELAQAGSLQRAWRGLGDQFFNQLEVLPSRYFESSQAEAASIDADTPVEKIPHLLCRVLEEADEAIIEFPGNRVRGPLPIAAALRSIAAATGPFTPRSLAGELTESAKLVLTRRLIKERLLRTAHRPENEKAPS